MSKALSFDYDEPYRVIVQDQPMPPEGGYPEYEQDPDYYDYNQQEGYYNSYYNSYRYSYSYYTYIDENGQ